MSNASSPTRSFHLSDEVLANLLEEFTALLQAGDVIDVDEHIARYPDYADQIRELVAALELLNGVAQPVDASLGQQRALGHTVRGTLGDFEILEEIGRGGMGVVYEARQMSLDRRVALKVLPFAAILDERQLTRFKNEARAAASLHHNNIVHVYSVGCERGVHYYAMEYVPGRTLAAIIRELRSREQSDGSPRGRASASQKSDINGSELSDNPSNASGSSSAMHSVEDEITASFSGTTASRTQANYFRWVAHLGWQAAEGLEHAHQLGVIHRDIKPSNLMTDSTEHLWITDFGLALTRTDSDLTVSGDVIGTLRYMSPEQAGGSTHSLDYRTDIYSLGVTLYELLCLRPAFAKTDRLELLEQILKDEPRPLRHVRKTIPRDLALIVQTAMSKDPATRYRTAQAMADDLQRFLRQQPVLATSPTVGQRLVKWCRRYRSIVTTAAVSVLILIAVSMLLMSRSIYRERALRKQAQQAQHDLERTELESRRTAYASDIMLASRAWEDGDVPQFKKLLDGLIPSPEQKDLRGFEWYYLEHLLHNNYSELMAHHGSAYTAVCSSDGQWLATSGEDCRIFIYETKTWRCTATLQTSQQEINGLAFSHENRLLAACGDDGTVWLIDLQTQRPIRKITTHDGESYSAVFAQDDRYLFTCGDSPVVHRWEVSTGKAAGDLTGHARAVEAMAMSPDGHLLATASSDYTARLWDMRTLQCLGELAQHDNVLSSVDFSCDGQYLATGSVDRTVCLWDVATQRLLATIPSVDAVQCLTFARDANQLAIGDRGGTLRVWQVEDVRGTHESGDDRNSNRPPNRSIVTVHHSHTGRIYSATFAPDGKLISAGEDGQVVAWNSDSSQFRHELSTHHPIRDATFAAGGRYLVGAGLGLHLVDAETGETVSTLRDPAIWWTQVVTANDRNVMAACSKNGDVEFLDVTRNTPLRSWQYAQDGEATLDIALDPSRRYIAINCWISPADTIVVLDTATGRVISEIPALGTMSMAFSPREPLLVFGSQNDVFGWDTRAERIVFRWKGHRSTIRSMTFSLDGRWLATASNDRSVRIWDMNKRHFKHELRGHRDAVRTVAFWPDGQTLLSAGDDGRVIAWQVVTGRELLELARFPGAVWKVAVSPDRQKLAIVTDNYRIVVLRLANEPPRQL